MEKLECVFIKIDEKNVLVHRCRDAHEIKPTPHNFILMKKNVKNGEKNFLKRWNFFMKMEKNYFHKNNSSLECAGPYTRNVHENVAECTERNLHS